MDQEQPGYQKYLLIGGATLGGAALLVGGYYAYSSYLSEQSSPPSDELLGDSAEAGGVVKEVTVRAPVNIAVIKYWGKRDEKLVLPLNSSLSGTLDLEDMCSTTTVATSPTYKEDKIWLNGKEMDLSKPRLVEFFKRLRSKAELSGSGKRFAHQKIHVVSVNNFPTAAGLASSASGYAALTFACAQLLGIRGETSMLARLGSGSATRSMYGGWVAWNKGDRDDGEDSIAVQVAPHDQWDMQVIVCVVSGEKKAVGSTDGMRLSAQTSENLRHRVSSGIVDRRMEDITQAIQHRDFDTFAEITMRDSDDFHACCADTEPPIFYMNDVSRSLVDFVNAFNAQQADEEGKGKRAAYTFDAGPNAVVYLPTEHCEDFLRALFCFFPKGEREREEAYYSHRGDLPFDPETLSKEELYSDGPLSELSVQSGVLNRIIHTSVGRGPVVVPRDQGASLINITTGEPLAEE